ncbi:MAG TPA: adenylate/guanylate cyclase domain-containing protein, partial [Alphaproteobacteria bacterium]|nr:adenylate/guanylate cyclase domain-containing protein [Alphaproteobacteria bacterium]
MIKFISNKWVHVFILISLLFGAVFFSGKDAEIRKRFQNFIFDSYNKIYQRPAGNDVVIIDIDENSLRKIGQWPWPRDIVADLITKLDKLGAKVIAFDMVFAEEDRTSPKYVVARLPDDETYDEIKQKIIQLPDNDHIFSQAIRDAGNIVTGFTSAKPNETRRLPTEPAPPTFLLKDKENLVRNPKDWRNGLATNLPIFSKMAAGNGHFMATPDNDGIIRKVSLLARYVPPQISDSDVKLYPSLALEALRVSISPKARMIVRAVKEKKILDLGYQIKIGQYEIPVGEDMKFNVYYRNIDKEKEYIPAHFILEDINHADIEKKIKDKIVFIGTSTEGLKDIRSTPLTPFVPGVEVHANVVEQILQGDFLKRPAFIDGLEAWIILVSGLLIILLTPLINILWLGILTVVLIGAMFAGSWYGYTNLGLLLDPVYPSLILFLLFVGSSLLSYLRSEIDRRQVKNAFGHYISPVFMEELTKNPDKLKLGGEVRELTVMFTDIRGFTNISESLSPERLIQLMNEFLTPMSDLVMQSRGTIDKYMGDAMMAFWNAPLDDPDHANQACLTALSMNKALEPINAQLKKEAEALGKEPLVLSAGIGINTGDCSVGNMGSKQRFAYSALGDTVNLASRLEGQTKTYGVDTLIGENTYRQVTNLAMLELDLIQVIGRDKPVKVYTLIGDADTAQDSSFKKWQAAHNGMLAAYRIADVDCAAQDCTEARELANGRLEKYYDLYMDRIIEITKNPPPE